MRKGSVLGFGPGGGGEENIVRTILEYQKSNLLWSWEEANVLVPDISNHSIKNKSQQWLEFVHSTGYCMSVPIYMTCLKEKTGLYTSALGSHL